MSDERTFGTITHEGSDVVERKSRRIAATFRRDDAMERRLELRNRDPEGFAKFPRDEQMAVSYYALARAAAYELALAEQEEDEAA